MSAGRFDLEMVRKDLRRRRQSTILKTAFRFYDVLGRTLAVAALGVFLIYRFNVDLSMEELTALALAGLGIATAVIAKLAATIFSERERLQTETYSLNFSLMRILNDWQRFEELAVRALHLDGEGKPRIARSLIMKLAAESVIPASDVEVLDNALLARNAVAHGRARAIPNSEIVEISSELARVVANLERYLQISGNPHSPV